MLRETQPHGAALQHDMPYGERAMPRSLSCRTCERKAILEVDPPGCAAETNNPTLSKYLTQKFMTKVE